MSCFPPVPETRTAYLLLFLDVSVFPPLVKDVVIRSEEHPSILGTSHRFVCLLKETARTYEDAQRELRRRLADDPYWSWVKLVRPDIRDAPRPSTR